MLIKFRRDKDNRLILNVEIPRDTIVYFCHAYLQFFIELQNEIFCATGMERGSWRLSYLESIKDVTKYICDRQTYGEFIDNSR